MAGTPDNNPGGGIDRLAFLRLAGVGAGFFILRRPLEPSSSTLDIEPLAAMGVVPDSFTLLPDPSGQKNRFSLSFALDHHPLAKAQGKPYTQVRVDGQFSVKETVQLAQGMDARRLNEVPDGLLQYIEKAVLGATIGGVVGEVTAPSVSSKPQASAAIQDTTSENATDAKSSKTNYVRNLMIAGGIAGGTLFVGTSCYILEMLPEEVRRNLLSWFPDILDGLATTPQAINIPENTPTPTRSSYIAIRTPTPAGDILILTPTETATAIATLTATRPPPTITMTPTESPTPTETAAPMEQAMVAFKTFNLGRGNSEFQDNLLNVPDQIGPHSYYEFISDPTGRLGGKGNYVLHYKIDGPPPTTKKIQDLGGVHRPHPFYYKITGRGAYGLEWDNLVEKAQEGLGDRGAPAPLWTSLASIGMPSSQDQYRVVAGAYLVTTGSQPYLELYTTYGKSVKITNPLPYPIGEKCKVRLELVKEAGKILARLFQGGYDKSDNFLGYTFHSETPLEDRFQDTDITQASFRLGGYAGNGVTDLEGYNANIALLTA